MAWHFVQQSLLFHCADIFIYVTGSCLDLIKWKIFYHKQETGNQVNTVFNPRAIPVQLLCNYCATTVTSLFIPL